MSPLFESGQRCYGRCVKKRFEFSMDQDLHSALKAFAEHEGVSMAAICREALQLHLAAETEKASYPLPEVHTVSTDDTWCELDDFLNEPYVEDEPYIRGEPSPWTNSSTVCPAPYLDLLDAPWVGPKVNHITPRPGPRVRRHHAPRRSFRTPNHRWLDEMWA